jgi:glutathione peroxidase-family protein
MRWRNSTIAAVHSSHIVFKYPVNCLTETACFVVLSQVLLIVNVASECGFTDDHYQQLVHLQTHFKDTGLFQVLAFPCNQFGGQEPKVCQVTFVIE